MKQSTFLDAVLGAIICSTSAWAVDPGSEAPAFTVKNVKDAEIKLSV